MRALRLRRHAALIAAPLDPHGGLSGKPQIVVQGEPYLNHGLGGGQAHRTFDYEGERFLMVRKALTDQEPTQIRITHGWDQELKRLVPAKP